MATSLGTSLGRILAELIMLMTLGIVVAVPFLLLAGVMSLLREELGLLREQTDQLLQLRFEFIDDLKKLLSSSDTPSMATLRDALLELDPKYRKKIRAILAEEQAGRFDEIVFQLRGARGLADPQTVLMLRLTGDQKSEIQRIVEIDPDDLKTSRKLFDIAAAFALRAQQQRAAVEVLSDKQRDQFFEMKGEAFNLLRLGAVLRIARNLLEMPPEDQER